jgi:K+-sensing histidine kinase KdpD
LLDREARQQYFEGLSRSWHTRWDGFVDAVYPHLEGVAKALRAGWDWSSQRPIILRWIIVAASVIVATILGGAFKSQIGAQGQLLLFLPAVMVSALYGGIMSGTAAAILGGLAAIVYFMMPEHAGQKEPSYVADMAQLFLYAVACSIVLGLARAQERQKDQIRQFAETLEDRVLTRTADLRRANDELAEFCYTISHDLRAPMRNIVATTTMLQEDLGDSAEEAVKQQLVSLGASAQRLANQVDDLLTHARLGGASVKPAWLNITALADDVLHQLRCKEWKFKMLNCRIQPGMVATGDRQLLRMVFQSLMENACKYAKEGEVLNLEITERRIKGVPTYCVRDNGIGFEMQYVEKIFQPFQKLHRDTEYSGTGIGLANAKRIIERHGGKIWAESEPGRGSVFFFTLQDKARSTNATVL